MTPADVAQWIAAAAAVAAVFWSHLTLRASIKALSKSLEDTRYSQLDSVHFELLRLRIEKPFLAGPRPSDPTKGRAWDEYACLVWSFVESIVDYCEGPGRNSMAWAPAVEHESIAYKQWLTGSNLKRFRPDFEARVQEFLRRSAVERAQAIVRCSVPEGISLADELIADRRREADLEFREFRRHDT